MKITLKNPKPAAAASSEPSAPEPPVPTPTSAKPGGLKLKLTSSAAPPADAAAAPSSEAPKPKRKYTKKPKVDENGQPLPTGKAAPKKRAREDAGEGGDSPVAKRKPKPTAKSLAMTADSDEEDELHEAPPPPRPVPVRTQSVKLSFKPKGGVAPAPIQRSNTAILKVKGGGKPPVRPPGVGYDSEAEEAEVDPAIESQFVLRMVPGPDCELLRKAIDEKVIGKSMSQGGPGVYFRFFDREGRRAMVTIQGRHYAASMVELPSVVESMKSWNKKDWVKTADVCQMLLVLGRVESEEEAKKHPRPPYVDQDSHRFPHGLTPPMRWARKRRFRPRKSYLDVERAEAAMNQLLVDDDEAESSRYELVDSDHESSEEESSSGEEEEEDEEMMNAPPVETMDAGDLEQMLHAGLMEDEEVDVEALFGGNDSATIEIETPATAHDVAMHALNANGSIIMEPETAASTPGAATSADDDDDNDGESDEDADDIDEEAAAKQEKEEQTRSEIRELDKTIEENRQQLAKTNNVMWKQRIQARIDKQVADRNIKLRSLGEEED